MLGQHTLVLWRMLDCAACGTENVFAVPYTMWPRSSGHALLVQPQHWNSRYEDGNKLRPQCVAACLTFFIVLTYCIIYIYSYLFEVYFNRRVTFQLPYKPSRVTPSALFLKPLNQSDQHVVNHINLCLIQGFQIYFGSTGHHKCSEFLVDHHPPHLQTCNWKREVSVQTTYHGFVDH